MSNDKFPVRSVFDIYNKLEHPSGGFAWMHPPHTFKLNKADIVCSGELQELESSTSGFHSSRFYAATITELIRFAVTQFPDS